MRAVSLVLLLTGHAASSKLAAPKTTARQLVNDPNDCVDEKIESMILTNPSIRKLTGYNVLVRSALDRCKVAIISGGGSGHEPSHAGWVAEGMLTGAVIGPVFVSPSVDDVLAAIHHCTGEGGCLVICKNYPTDIEAFGKAVELARADGLQVNMVVVGDDCALQTDSRRGIAGTCFVHKVAGAAAEAGGSLEFVTKEAEDTIKRVGTMGVALRTCRVPGYDRDERIADGKMEVGLGIHGEPGAFTADIAQADVVVEKLIDHIYQSGYLPLKKGERVALMVNNLGCSSVIEMQVCTRKALKLLQSEKYGLEVSRVFVGNFMTALDMIGISISLLKVTDDSLKALDAPTAAKFWPSKPAILSKIMTEHKRKPQIHGPE